MNDRPANSDISVIYPAYNEADNIRSTIQRSIEALRPLCRAFELLIVNDASKDDTGRIAEELAAKYPEVRVIHNARNLGQGASIVRGFRDARYGLLIHNGMDYPFDLKDLAILLPASAEADIVVAVRKSRAGYSQYRKLTSVVNLALLHTLFPHWKLRDYNFVQLYPRSAWERLKVDARSTAFLTPEALIRAHDLGYVIREVEIDYLPRVAGIASSGSPKVIIRSLGDMFRFWLKRTLGRTPSASRQA
jgi:glycosyltransferase involved in cell wall biosynthesis